MSLLELIETVRPVLGSMKKFEEGVEGAERETIQDEWRESYHGCVRSSIVDLPADARVHFIFAKHPEISPVVVGDRVEVRARGAHVLVGASRYAQGTVAIDAPGPRDRRDKLDRAGSDVHECRRAGLPANPRRVSFTARCG